MNLSLIRFSGLGTSLLARPRFGEKSPYADTHIAETVFTETLMEDMFVKTQQEADDAIEVGRIKLRDIVDGVYRNHGGSIEGFLTKLYQLSQASTQSPEDELDEVKKSILTIASQTFFGEEPEIAVDNAAIQQELEIFASWFKSDFHSKIPANLPDSPENAVFDFNTFSDHYIPEFKESAPEDIVRRSIRKSMRRAAVNRIKLNLDSVWKNVK